MNIQPIKTHKIQPNENIFAILDQYLPKLEENSVVAIASKIVGICEGRVIKKKSDEQRDTVIKQEAEYYLPKKRKGFLMTINNNTLVANAGIDESNSNGMLSLWPKNPQKSVNNIREYLTKKHKIKNLGIILTDSKLTPLRSGVTAYALSYSGFNPLKNYIGEKDIFGQAMHVEQINIADSLATSATLSMGEGNEQQPLSLITDVSFVTFHQRNPTQKELQLLIIKPEDDLFASLLTSVQWKQKK